MGKMGVGGRPPRANKRGFGEILWKPLFLFGCFFFETLPYLDAEIAPVHFLGCCQCRAGAGKRIKYQISSAGKSADDGFQGGDRLLRRMQANARESTPVCAR